MKRIGLLIPVLLLSLIWTGFVFAETSTSQRVFQTLSDSAFSPGFGTQVEQGRSYPKTLDRIFQSLNDEPYQKSGRTYCSSPRAQLNFDTALVDGSRLSAVERISNLLSDEPFYGNR